MPGAIGVATNCHTRIWIFYENLENHLTNFTLSMCRVVSLRKPDREGGCRYRSVSGIKSFRSPRHPPYGQVSASVTKAIFSIDESVLFAVSVQEFLKEALVGKRRQIVFGSEFEKNRH